MDNRTCNLCNALLPYKNVECHKCSGKENPKYFDYLFDKIKFHSLEECESFLKESEDLFFDKKMSPNNIYGDTLVTYLLDKLFSHNKHISYSAILGLRMLGFEVWAVVDDEYNFMIRKPNSDKLNYMNNDKKIY